MKIQFVIASFPLLLNAISIQAPPDTVWTKVFGNGWEGGCYSGDVGTSVLEKDDGGFLITGWLANDDDSDIWLLSTNEQGDTIWTKSFSGFMNDAAFCLQRGDVGYYIFGERGGGTSNAGWILNVDYSGNLIWDEYYNLTGAKTYTINLSCARKLENGDFIICGRHYGSGLIFRINSVGDTIWTKSFRKYPYNTDDYSSVEISSNGDLVFSFNTKYGNIDKKVFLYRLTEIGEVMWERECTEINGVSRSLQTLDDGGIIMSGNYTLPDTTSDSTNATILKLDEDGNLVWQKIYEIAGNQTINCVRKLYDGGFILAGETEVNGIRDALLLKTDQDGNLLWTKTLGNEYDDYAYSIEQTSDGGYVVTGGICADTNQVPDLWLIKLAGDTVTNVLTEKSATNFYLSYNFPNPFNPSTKIKYTIPSVETRDRVSLQLKVYDILGNELETLVNEEKPTGTYELTWYAEGLPSGVYFYRIQAGSFVETKKMILMK